MKNWVKLLRVYFDGSRYIGANQRKKIKIRVIGCLYQVNTGYGADDEFGQAHSYLPEVDILL